MSQPIPSPAQIAKILREREPDVPYDQSLENMTQEQVVRKAEEIRDEIDKTLEKMKRGAGTRDGMILRNLYAILQERYNFSAAEDLILMAIALRDQPLFIKDRIQVLKVLIKYELPELKQVDVKGSVKQHHHVHIVRYGEDGVVSKEALKNPVNRNLLDSNGRAVVVDVTEVPPVGGEVKK